MTGEIARGAKSDPAVDHGSYAKAILNILGDFSEEKAQLQDTQKAILNVLEDAGVEKLRIETTEKAMLNILEDFAGEKARLESTQKATLNILEDFDAEKSKVEQTNREMAREIVERKRAEDGLEAANKELESFSYSVSHDLRAPLRAVDGYAQMLEEDCADRLDSEGRRLLGVVRGEAKRMGQLIDDLLAFSRLGRKVVTSAGIDMKRLVEEVIKEVQVAAERPAQMVLGALPPAHGDTALVKQVWLNLLSNAIKFSSSGEQPVVEISGRRDGAYNVYCVKDNGAGFDMQYYDKLFGVFQRLHGNDEFPGTGVGLAIVERVVTRHGGRVWAEGKVDDGAAFYFSLPKEKPDGQV